VALATREVRCIAMPITFARRSTLHNALGSEYCRDAQRVAVQEIRASWVARMAMWRVELLLARSVRLPPNQQPTSADISAASCETVSLATSAMRTSLVLVRLAKFATLKPFHPSQPRHVRLWMRLCCHCIRTSPPAVQPVASGVLPVSSLVTRVTTPQAPRRTLAQRSAEDGYSPT